MTETSDSPPPARPRTVASVDWGRVDADGDVWVRTTDGERVVGSWQAEDPEAGLAFFVRRFDDLATQVSLLEQRVASGAAAPDDAVATSRRLLHEIGEAQAVGDLDALLVRLSDLQTRIDERRSQRRAERAKAQQEARGRKEAVIAEAERVAESTDWRHGADRLRTLLDSWKALPRLDKPTDDALWHRFSGARSTYTRRRRAHFGEVAEKREAARVAKEALADEAESLADSTEWGPTAGRYRELMTRWKAAGHAARDVDDALWQRFRSAQDRFFAARNEALSVRDTGQREALATKRVLLTEAEALVPVRSFRDARAALRSVHERWDVAGPVPRDAVKGLEARLRAVDDAVRDAERSEWRRTDPAARARAAETVDKLRSSIASLDSDLTRAQEKGDERAATEARAALDARREWLAQAETSLADFS